MPAPYTGPTSNQFAPIMGEAQLDDAGLAPMSQTFVTGVPHITYIVQEGDTIEQVARTLYGENTPQSRARVRRGGFHVGAVHKVPRQPFHNN